MLTEFWLQKKPFNSWQHVTWYATLEEARSNFNRMKESSGYSWRIVEANVVEECLLEGERPVMRQEEEGTEDHTYPQQPVEPVKPSWGSQLNWPKHPVLDAPENNKSSDHGMVGKVWLGNPVTKEKKRVDPAMVADMMDAGWIKAGPRTVL